MPKITSLETCLQDRQTTHKWKNAKKKKKHLGENRTRAQRKKSRKIVINILDLEEKDPVGVNSDNKRWIQKKGKKMLQNKT